MSYLIDNGSPLRLEIHPTLICNLRCGYCSLRILERYESIDDMAAGLGIPVDRIRCKPVAGAARVEDFLNETHVSLEKQLNTVNEALALGVREFRVSGGGEPLCTPETTFAIIQAMSAGGGSVELVTNGVLLERHIDRVLETGLDILSVSMDVADPVILETRRGKKGIFSLIAKALQRIISLRRTMRPTRLRLHLYSVLDGESVGYIPALVLFAKENEIERINFIFRKDGNMPCSEELGRIAKSTQNLLVASNINEIYALTCADEKGRGKPSCSYPFSNIVVHANGLVTPCCSMKWGVGEFVQDKPLGAVWRGEFFADTRTAFAAGKKPEWCQNCWEPKVLN